VLSPFRGPSITILDVKKGDEPKLTGKLSVEGPEGYAVDQARGLFYTNLEDLDRTVVFDAGKVRAAQRSIPSGATSSSPAPLAR
jgi:hypothetical protein